jgi:hypothetical protein
MGLVTFVVVDERVGSDAPEWLMKTRLLSYPPHTRPLFLH